ncbi:MFS transporter, AAHS family, benzoate transport protein [Streptoalloteichus tenebrarius]|uniref:MFS transporter, AAHS family, benzoate transport protein n=1 Tax=Streptoalloteichus tenebrarius (strain ATCC 17920 / DSM 40477 / JCM 4838 / CBS 697.72 / NBRC 16177 / NCIMB 11028 / NRRL B-12390 / A12253. 1 / ISP 5477) TaxID=1933 RepID=A0ABT1HN71_STRSD|nr:aromatic acid/H+ symport family MFS transporter [Streptoalloteichus tenebrarius]MCP2256949.1 MFS transporter, AAHS family, benzoate transport protein [Streptoalloteichus tenebrarius]BFF00139.1 aromatic acid/H+ symport family MFS transporter [Streptoalloteichus tenebrarius]
MTVTGGGRAGRTCLSAVAVCGLAMIFDGYDLVVYGATLPTLSRQWSLSPEQAGAIGSYVLVGMLLGAVVVGTVSDLVGRRRTVLLSVVWFSAAMLLCAVAPDPTTFGLLRFLAGLGLGGMMPTVSALAVEYAPPRHRNLTYATVFSGYAVGGMASAGLALVLPQDAWRLMYALGALALLLVPVALRWLPESIDYLVARGRLAEAVRVADRFGLARPVARDVVPEPPRAAVRSLFAGRAALATTAFWAASFCGLLLVYGVNTWLPQIMRAAGYPLGSSLAFLMVFNVGSIVGSVAGGWSADRLGSKALITTAFLVACGAIGLMAAGPPAAVLHVLVALGGFGTIGTQNLINAYVARYHAPARRATALGWSLGVGRLGAICGPLVGGLVLGSGLGAAWNFVVFAAVALVGALAIVLVPAAEDEGNPAPAVSAAPAAPVAAGEGSG